MSESSSPSEYGKHLTLYADVGASNEILVDPDRISLFLSDLVSRIGMRILSGPITGVESSNPENEGCSGVVILYESHAAIHTYSNLQKIFVDVFSCRDFETTEVVDEVDQSFGLVKCNELNSSGRGSHWNEDVEASLKTWRARR